MTPHFDGVALYDPSRTIRAVAEVQHFEQLHVYREAFRLQQDFFALSKRFPREERYSLTDQLRRSSRSVGANLAEAWHERRYVAHFASALTDADAERGETEHRVATAFACGYLTEDDHERLLVMRHRIGGRLGRMLGEPERWGLP